MRNSPAGFRPRALDGVDYGDGLTALKEASGLTWRQFCRLVQVDYSNIKQWRAGRDGLTKFPSGKLVARLTDFAQHIGALDIFWDAALGNASFVPASTPTRARSRLGPRIA